MKKAVLAIMLTLTCSSSALAQFPEDWRSGHIQKLYIDPSDVVVQLDEYGPCGSNFFHIRRSNANFAELFASVLTAKSKDMTVGFAVTDCTEDDPGVFTRNVADHGYIE